MIKVLVVAVLALVVLVPVVALAHGGTDVTVTGDVRSNGPIEITGEDFKPNDVVRIELRKDGVEPIELGRVPVDADGGFTETLHVPATVPPGIYQLAAEGEESATFDVTVLELAEGTAAPMTSTEAAAASSSNDRPAGETLGLAVFTAAIALAAVGLLWASRTHARSAQA